jgi:hypothetical protein
MPRTCTSSLGFYLKIVKYKHFRLKKICISGIATLIKHSLPTQQKKRGRKRELVCYKYANSNRTPQTIKEKENLWGYRLGTVSGKTNILEGILMGIYLYNKNMK